MRDAQGFTPQRIVILRRRRIAPALLAAAMLAALACYFVPRGLDANEQLASEDDPAQIAARALDHSFDAELAQREIAAAQVQGKPPAAMQKIIEGKLEKYYSTVCLLDQPFVKQPEKMVKDLITEKVAKTGENIQVRRFVRFQLGVA